MTEQEMKCLVDELGRLSDEQLIEFIEECGRRGYLDAYRQSKAGDAA